MEIAVKNLGEDPVTKFLKKKARQGGTIHCSLCHTVYDVKVRNCKNAQCSVINIRAAKATQQDVVHEVHRQRVQGKRSVVMEWEVTFEEGGAGEAKKQSPVKSSTAMVTPAKSNLVEPCFVNPSSHAAAKELMRHGRLAGVMKYGGIERQCVAMTYDGVPYMLMRKVIQESRLLAAKSYLQSLG